MSNSRTISKFLSLWLAAALVLGTFAAMPVAAAAQDSQLPAPGNPSWSANTGIATWDRVEGAGKPNDWGSTAYYKWELYRYDTDSITDVSELSMNNSVRYGVINDDSPVERVNLASWITQPGYYYFTVFAYGSGETADSAPALSPAFHYTTPVAKLPTPANLKWEFHAPKWYGVWDDIFAAAFEDAEGFLVECENGSGEIEYQHLFVRGELMTEGKPGTILWMDNPNGRYRFRVQAVSGDLNATQSGEWSEFSPWVDVYPPNPDNGGGSGGGGGGSSSSGGSLLGSSGSATATPPASSVQTPTQIKDLASAAKSKGETAVRSSATKEATVKGSAWSQLGGLSFQHDTVANGAVQVRVTINNPAALTQDLKVSAYVTGKDVAQVSNLFSKHFSNAVRVMHFDQTGAWGQQVRIAAKFDLTGMDKNNLVFYSFDKATNKYQKIEKAAYIVDANGYTHFSTSNAGNIIVSDGALSKK